MSKKIGSLDWRLRPGKVGQPPPTCDAPPKRPQTQNWQKGFSVETRWLAESVDALNTSLALRTGELWNYKIWSKKWLLWSLQGKTVTTDSTLMSIKVTVGWTVCFWRTCKYCLHHMNTLFNVCLISFKFRTTTLKWILALQNSRCHASLETQASKRWKQRQYTVGCQVEKFKCFGMVFTNDVKRKTEDWCTDKQCRKIVRERGFRAP